MNAREAMDQFSGKVLPLVREGWVRGLVAGVIDGSGEIVRGFGRTRGESGAVPDGTTVYPIASITKVFTGICFADMVREGLVRPRDPVARYLPRGVRMPEWKGRKVTLLDLSTHTSGFPRKMPKVRRGFRSERAVANPAIRLFRGLAATKLSQRPGTKEAYSNYGVGLLGFILARVNGTSYERMVEERVTGPLGLADTRIRLTPDMAGRLARGFNPMELPEPPMYCAPTELGSGGLFSTANDLLVLLAAVAGIIRTPLDATLRLGMRRWVKVGKDQVNGMGWMMNTRYGICGHGGRFNSYNTTIIAIPARRFGIVVLHNTHGMAGPLGIWLALSLAGHKWAFPRAIKRIRLPRRLLGEYAGCYRWKDGGRFQLRVGAGGLVAPYEEIDVDRLLRPVSRDSFVDGYDQGALRFSRDASGAVRGLSAGTGKGKRFAIRIS